MVTGLAGAASEAIGMGVGVAMPALSAMPVLHSDAARPKA
jgi:hypothetical protein